jgi:hypothetical protein
VASAVAGKASFEERVLTVLETVRDGASVSVDADPELTRFAVAPLSEVWRTSWATPLELAALAAAALDSAGVDAVVGLVGDPGRDGARVAGFVGFDRPVVLFADRDGCLRVVDPLTPLSGGPLEESVRDRSVLTALPRPAGSACGRGPVAWRRSLTAVLSVGTERTITGELELSMSGSATPHAALVHDASTAASQLAAFVPGGAATEIRTPVLSRRSATVVATVTGALEGPDTSGLVRLDFGEIPRLTGDALPRVPDPGRLAPLLLGGPGEEAVEATVSLAPGWTVAALPTPVAVENAVGSVRVSAEITAGGAVRINRRITLAGRVALASSAADVRALLAAWRSSASQGILLRLPDAAR